MRQQMKLQMQMLDHHTQEAESASLAGAIAQTEPYARATAILGFVALPGEPDLQLLYDRALQSGKRVGLPRCMPDGSLRFHSVANGWRNRLVKNRWNIAEPDPSSCGEIRFGETDHVLILVPGLAFTPHRTRLGRGKGFYDRFLAAKGPNMVSIGVCFTFQLVAELPTGPADRSVDMVVTPDARY